MLSKARDRRAEMVQEFEDALKKQDEKIAGYEKQAEATLEAAKDLLIAGKSPEQAKDDIEAEIKALYRKRDAIGKLDETKLAQAKGLLDAEAASEPAEEVEVEAA